MIINNDLIKYAYIRGYLKLNNIHCNLELLNKDLLSLSNEEVNELNELAKIHNIKTYYFKEKELLPRVNIILGFLKGIEPNSLLDVGSGRGVFLFPLLNEFPYLKITSIDILEHRVKMLEYIKEGGISNIEVYNDDICSFNNNEKYEVVTLLEVLEHIPNVVDAIKNAINLSSKFIVVTVPSKEDNNPEHIHLLTKEKLTKLFNDLGVTNLKFSGVNNHLVLIARKSDENER